MSQQHIGRWIMCVAVMTVVVGASGADDRSTRDSVKEQQFVAELAAIRGS